MQNPGFVQWCPEAGHKAFGTFRHLSESKKNLHFILYPLNFLLEGEVGLNSLKER